MFGDGGSLEAEADEPKWKFSSERVALLLDMDSSAAQLPVSFC